MERSRTEHADEISDLEQARSRLEAEISLEIAARNESEDRLGAVEAEAEALREEVDSLRKVESMAIEGVERLEDQVDDMLRGCGGSLHCIMHSLPPLPHRASSGGRGGGEVREGGGRAACQGGGGGGGARPCCAERGGAEAAAAEHGGQGEGGR